LTIRRGFGIFVVMTTITSFLSNILGIYKEYDTGELYFACPFCHNRKHKFAVNIHNLRWHCWHCSAKGRSLITLCKRLDISKEQINQLRELINPDEIKKYKKYEADTTTELFLPKEYQPLWIQSNNLKYKHALRYVLNRVKPVDIFRYKIGYCESGIYADRIIIPSYDGENKLNFFVARSFYDSGMKYKNPTVSKNIIMFENQISWNLPLVLCEGVFDAITIRQNAIPLLGKHIPNKLMKKIIEHNINDITVFLDSDAHKEAYELTNKLKVYGIDVKTVLLSNGDAGSMTPDQTWEKILTAPNTTFKDFIASKIIK
jgi:hypothetical protein